MEIKFTFQMLRHAVHILFGLVLVVYIIIYSVSWPGMMFLLVIGLAFECLYLALDEIIYRLGVLIDRTIENDK